MSLVSLGFQAMLAVAASTACGHSAPADHYAVQNVAISPDASKLAVIVKYERYGVATGLAAFPDGGVPKMFEQRADVYVVALPTRELLFRGHVPAPAAHTVAFAPWLLGWHDQTVYFKITGCPGRPGDPCGGARLRQTVYALSPSGTIEPQAPPADVMLASRLTGPGHPFSASTEPYGVSTSTGYDAPRIPLLEFAGSELRVVAPAARAMP